MFGKKGQSTLEYVLVLTAIIAVVIIVAGGVLRNQTQASLTHVTNQMQTQVAGVNFNNR